MYEDLNFPPLISPLAYTGSLSVSWRDQLQETPGSRAASAEMHQEGQEIPIERGAEEKNNVRVRGRN